MENKEKKQEHQQKDDKMIFLVILTSDGSKTLENDFPKTMKVSELIQKIANQFNLAPNGQYELRLQSNLEEPLKPERTLVSYQIEDGAKVIFTDYGKGV
jgi:hypothetical protein